MTLSACNIYTLLKKKIQLFDYVQHAIKHSVYHSIMKLMF
jgi:hypothetical protein